MPRSVSDNRCPECRNSMMMDIQCVGDAAQTQGLTVEVGGCRITVGTETDPELLSKVCRALKEL